MTKDGQYIKTKQRASKRSGDYREVVVMEKKDPGWITVLRREHNRLFWGGIATVGAVDPLPEEARAISSTAPPVKKRRICLAGGTRTHTTIASVVICRLSG